jgi:hypothetical protein
VSSGNLRKLQQAVAAAEAAAKQSGQQPSSSRSLDRARRALAKIDGLFSHVREAVADRDVDALNDLLAEAREKGLVSRVWLVCSNAACRACDVARGL